MEPYISLIIPVYNVDQFLPRLFESIEKNTPEEIKIVADFIIQGFFENILGYSNYSLS